MKGLIFAACLGVAVLSTGCNDDIGKSPQSTGGTGTASGGAAPAATQQAAAPAPEGEHNRLPIAARRR